MQVPIKSDVLWVITSKVRNMSLTFGQSSQDHGTNRNKWLSQVRCVCVCVGEVTVKWDEVISVNARACVCVFS